MKAKKIPVIMGTGGIGIGAIYALEGDHDLGRNESRMAARLGTRDFCKLHIIFHYVASLLREMKIKAQVLPVGAVGDDEPGRALPDLMRRAGMDTTHVAVLKGVGTLHSVCFLYADRSGGNITCSNSASSRVTPAMIRRAAACRSPDMVLAAPEVPMAARRELLKQGRRHGALNAASFVAEEIREACITGMLKHIDLLSLNMEEAARLGGLSPHAGAGKIVRACARRVQKENPDMRILVTDGGAGSYGLWRKQTAFLPALKVKARSTAGAGDASVAGLMIGAVAGFPFISRQGPSCMKLARLIAAMSVTSNDTINFDIHLRSLKAFAEKHKLGKIF